MFITFEGIEGSGKTTQIKRLAQDLEAKGNQVVLTREPGGTPIGDQIRKILVDSSNSEMVPECEVLLYYASRAQHVRQVIQPALKEGKIVLCDRYNDATLAYQGYARSVQWDILNQLQKYVVDQVQPDLTLLLDMPAEKGLKRALERAQNLAPDQKEDRMEKEALNFHESVRQGYLDLAAKQADRFVLIDASLGVEEVYKRVFNAVFTRLNRA